MVRLLLIKPRILSMFRNRFKNQQIAYDDNDDEEYIVVSICAKFKEIGASRKMLERG
jgi:hypothetical protein